MYEQLAELERHCEAYAAWFSAVDEELYSLFRARAAHDDQRSVYAKATFLNRVYMTGLERAGSSVDPCAVVARILVSNGREIDERIAELGAIGSPTREGLAAIAQVHGWLTRDVLGEAEVGLPVSFVSKYLHFHVPIVPIYDGLACRALGRYTRARFARRFKATDARLPKLPGQLSDYRWLCARFLPLWDEIQESRPGTSVKQVDHHLWQLGAGR